MALCGQASDSTIAPKVEVIICTAAEPRRASSLRRAIESVLSQRGVEVCLHIIANGRVYDAGLLRELEAEREWVFHYLPEPHAAAARLHGRRCVSAPFFAFLDDDDVLLDMALRKRVQAIDPGYDVVVTNGIGTSGGRHVPEDLQVASDPLAAMLVLNWWASAAGLYRTSAIGAEFFERLPPYFEWTALAWRILTSDRRVRYVDDATFRLFHTEGSLSQVRTVQAAEDAVAVSVLLFDTAPVRLRAQARRTCAGAWHELSECQLRTGQFRAAWASHWKSLTLSRGAYLPFTRWLLTRRLP